MTDRYDALAYALAELTTAHKVISNTPDLTTSDLASILGPLGDAISDAMNQIAHCVGVTLCWLGIFGLTVFALVAAG